MLEIPHFWSIIEIYLENDFPNSSTAHSIFHNNMGRQNQSLFVKHLQNTFYITNTEAKGYAE